MVSVDENGRAYVGLTLAWDYNWYWVTVSMPRYVKEALHMFQHKCPKNLNILLIHFKNQNMEESNKIQNLHHQQQKK